MTQDRVSSRKTAPIVLVAVGAAAALLWLWPEASQFATRIASQSAGPVSLLPDRTPTQSTAQPPPPSAASIPVIPGPIPPSFDVVRVSPNGSAVLAGQAEPGYDVVVRDGDTILGTAHADARGNWVLIPGQPLASGGRELTLTEAEPSGPVVKGRESVLLAIPQFPVKPKIADASVTNPVEPTPPAPAPIPEPAPAPAQAPAVALLLPQAGPPRLLQTSPAAPRPATAALGLGTVDYTESGDIRFTGTAAPGASVRVFVDNAPAGDVVADASGKWELTPTQPVAGGVHRLRLDQATAAGDRVAARVELPFERTVLPPESVAAGRVVVQPGQNLWRIARHTYGSGVRYTVIYLANQEQIRDPKRIYPGQALTLPTP